MAWLDGTQRLMRHGAFRQGVQVVRVVLPYAVVPVRSHGQRVAVQWGAAVAVVDAVRRVGQGIVGAEEGQRGREQTLGVGRRCRCAGKLSDPPNAWCMTSMGCRERCTARAN